MKSTHNIEDYLIFTDLDGTLLNHHSYSFEKAQEMLDIIKSHSIPLIIVTSKTKSEVVEIQSKLKISFPFIIENGAGIFIPEKNSFKCISLGNIYSETLNVFKKYKRTISMLGFHEMSDEEVASSTGLPLEKAILAKKRTFSEPFILNKTTDLIKLKQLANDDGFDVVKGGRFYHLITNGQDKANAVKELHTYYETLHSKKYKTIALGDGENDITMLNAVDQAILIKKLDNTYITCEIPNIIKTDFIGPEGWDDSLKRFFDVK